MAAPERRRRWPLLAFFLRAALLLVVSTVLWLPVADWAMRPAATLAGTALGLAFPWWAGESHYRGDTLELDTRIEVAVAAGQARGELVVDAQPARYGYGLPMLLALLLAARARHRLRKLAVGILVLIPCQAFSIALVLLKQAALGSGAAATGQTGFGPWQLEAVALGYQFGVLLLPSLAPMIVWLLLDRSFLAALVLEGQMRRCLSDQPE